jgi:hypothetical protein
VEVGAGADRVKEVANKILKVKEDNMLAKEDSVAASL